MELMIISTNSEVDPVNKNPDPSSLAVYFSYTNQGLIW